MKCLSQACLMAVIASGFSTLSQAEELRIHIPETSSMQLYSPDNFHSLVSFTGQVSLQGTLLAVSEAKNLDGEQEWVLSLLFQPAASELAQLPTVRFESEPAGKPSSERFIELNYFQKEQLPATIAAIFGNEAAANLSQQAATIAKEGQLTLDAFRTGVECDRRHYYANVVSFKPDRELTSQQLQQLAKKIPTSCS